MENDNSILDKIITNQIAREKQEFSPAEIISKLLSGLISREAQVLRLRFGLDGSLPRTLEAIGKEFSVTRERIRQIEKQAVIKVKTLDFFSEAVGPVAHLIKRELRLSGGLMHQDELVRELSALSDDSKLEKNDIAFLISQLLTKEIKDIQHPHAHEGWALSDVNFETWELIVGHVVELFSENRKTMIFEKLFERIKEPTEIEEKLNHLSQLANVECGTGLTNDQVKRRIVKSHLVISRKIDVNPFGHWGLVEWSAVRPKRMGDKIYLVLKNIGEPQHFQKITDLVNQAKFDRKTAYSPTAHNELILDKRFVLVGRGIYALREWGYEEGVVSDVIAKVLDQAGQPLGREAIVEQVLKLRLVKKGTVYLALNDQARFTKLPDGRYQLGQKSEDQNSKSETMPIS